MGHEIKTLAFKFSERSRVSFEYLADQIGCSLIFIGRLKLAIQPCFINSK